MLIRTMAAIYRNRQLLYLAVVLFFFFSGVACLIPFLSLHMRQLGFTLEDTAFINMAAAFISIIGPPFVGLLSEKKSKYKLMIVLSLLGAGLAYTALTFVPRVVRIPRKPMVEFDCGEAIRIERCDNWNTCGDVGSESDNMTTFQISNCQYKCPPEYDLNMSYPLHVCFHGDDGNICIVYNSESEPNATLEFQSRLPSWPYSLQQNVKTSEFVTFDPSTTSDHSVDVCSYRSMAPIFVNKKEYSNIGCRPLPKRCSVKCNIAFTESPSLMAPSSCVQVIGDPFTTFWAYFGIRAFADMCLVTVVCLLDAVTITSLNDFEGAYGRTRVWPALGLAIFPPLSGILVDWYSDSLDTVDYAPAVYFFDGLALLACILTIILPFHEGKKSRHFESLEYKTRETRFCNVEMVVLLTLTVLLGTQWGFLQTFLHWFFADIGCSHFVLGLTLTVGFGVSLPFLVISKNMVRNIGRANLIVFAFLFYGTRYGGISFVSYPWWTLPFAAMEAFSLCVMWVALVAYGQSLAPKGCRLVVQYTLNILHFCIGRGVGSFLGGLFTEKFGTRQSYRGVAVFSAVVGLLYLALYHLCLKRNRKAKQTKTKPVLINGIWYPLGERHPNGDAKAHQPIVADQDDSDSATSGTDTK